MLHIKDLFHIDSLTLLMMGLIGFVGICIASFSLRYLNGDSQQQTFYIHLTALISSLFVLVSSDNMLLFVLFWAISNFLLVQLMLHKKVWSAAQESAKLAFKNFAVGATFLSLGFFILYWATGLTSIQALLQCTIPTKTLGLSSFFIFLAAMTQSALFPFHKWLISSLNSPTPVSALMHAGLINGGGFLLVRFAPLFLQQSFLLHIIFVVGIFTALLGTLWKLMQNDIKRMLACSTIGQMGFMIAQCGLGLFGAALAHLYLHGLFKAYLFLGIDTTAGQKTFKLNYPPTCKEFISSLFCGAMSAYIFCLITGKTIFAGDTTLILITLVLITGAQFTLPLLKSNASFKFLFSLVAATLMGTIYGINVQSIYSIVRTMHITQAQPLDLIYIVGLLLLVIAWLSMIFGHSFMKKYKHQNWILKWYVYMLNAHQPDKKTITTHHNNYQYKEENNE